MPTYLGSCHCGAVRFEVQAEIDHLRECDCSICRRRGALTFRVERHALRLLTPLAEMTVYRWGTRTAEDYFCPKCGILPFRKPSAPSAAERARGVMPFDGWSVNIRCLETIDIAVLPRVQICGSDLEI
jgi:hypothetical protein